MNFPMRFHLVDAVVKLKTAASTTSVKVHSAEGV